MKRTPILILAVVLTVCALLVIDRLEAQGSAGAKVAQPTRVGVCDVVTIFNKSLRASALNTRFETRGAELEKEREVKTKMIDAAQKALADECKPGTEAYENRLSTIRKMLIKLKVWEEVQNAAVKRDRYVLTRALHNEIVAAIEVEAKMRGMEIVLHQPLATAPDASLRDMLDRVRSPQVLYSAKSMDLTAAVLKLINDRYLKNTEK